MLTADALVFSLIFLLIFLILAAYHKLSLAINNLRSHVTDKSDNVISQIESLVAVYAEIRPIHGLPKTRGWAASPDFLHYLCKFVAEQKPQTVVECSSGLSTLVLAANIKKLGRGHVYSLEHDPAYSAKTRELIRSHNLEEWSTVIDAPLKPMSINNWEGEWYDFSRLENNLNNAHIDMLVVDGPPHFTAPLARYPALPVFAAAMSPGSHVLLDDADRSDEQVIVRRWGNEYASFILVDGLTAEKGISVLKNQSN